MKLLIIGGTRFLGRHLVELAVARGHEVSIFNRGQTNPDLFPNVEALHGDRDGNLTVLIGREWDAVIDTCGYVPRIVSQSVDLLKENVPQYTFISSISVYPNFPETGMDETYHVDTLPQEDKDSEDISKYYGALKALCEEAVQNTYGAGALIVRPGLIVGPHDPTDRFTYWPHRFAKGGPVLLPGAPDSAVQFIDVRDLAVWTLDMVERRQAGVYNATGPASRYTMEQLADECQLAAKEIGVESTQVWVDEVFLKEHEVGSWIELPLWIPEEAGWPGFSEVSAQKAKANGLQFRPVADTVRATLEWDRSRDDFTWKAGLNPDKEKRLLTLWNDINK